MQSADYVTADTQLLRRPLSSATWLLLATALIVLIGVIDFLSGTEIAFALFYIMVVALVAVRTTPLWPTSIVVVESAAAWLTAEWLAQDSSSATILIWNATSRLIIFATVGLMLYRLKHALDIERRYSRTDYVTRVANARGFAERARIEAARAQRYGLPLTIAHMDLDHFKSVNDAFGHSRGDEALNVVATTLTRNLREIDTVARVGGDEFVVLLNDIHALQAKLVFQKLRRILLAAMEEHGWPITFSIGVATFHAPFPTVDDLIRQADRVMYAAKNGGKNRIFTWTDQHHVTDCSTEFAVRSRAESLKARLAEARAGTSAVGYRRPAS